MQMQLSGKPQLLVMAAAPAAMCMKPVWVQAVPNKRLCHSQSSALEGLQVDTPGHSKGGSANTVPRLLHNKEC